MITHIDLSSVLRGAVCDLYSNLVTRPTGRAVRGEIERLLAEIGGRSLTVVDFSHVGLLDVSCADEIVAKLLLRARETAATGGEEYFVFRGIHEHHLDAIEAVLEHHGLAAILERHDGELLVVGVLDDAERRAWQVARGLGIATPHALAERAGVPLDSARAALESLCSRRLVMRATDGAGYVVISGGARH